MSDTYPDDGTNRDDKDEDLLGAEDVIDRIDELHDDIEQARYEICSAGSELRYPDSSLHFEQMLDHLETIESMIEYRQMHDTPGWFAYAFFEHSTRGVITDQGDGPERVYEEKLGTSWPLE
jgi:hypothetical protein